MPDFHSKQKALGLKDGEKAILCDCKGMRPKWLLIPDAELDLWRCSTGKKKADLEDLLRHESLSVPAGALFVMGTKSMTS